MHKTLLFSDLHITRAGETIIGLDPAARFRAALDHALCHHGDAEHVVILGDLTHRGTAQEYARLADILDDCPLPVTLTLGNHDARPAFDAAFPDAFRTASGHAQVALDLGPATRLLVLDTHDDDGHAPAHGGWLCDARLAWLDAELAQAEGDGRGVVILAHHPCFATGFDAMDAIALANPAALQARLRHDIVQHLICGHVHRAIQTGVAGCPASVLKSPCHQMPLTLGPAGVHDSIDEPGGYGLLCALGGQVILHTQDVLPDAAIGKAG